MKLENSARLSDATRASNRLSGEVPQIIADVPGNADLASTMLEVDSLTRRVNSNYDTDTE